MLGNTPGVYFMFPTVDDIKDKFISVYESALTASLSETEDGLIKLGKIEKINNSFGTTLATNLLEIINQEFDALLKTHSASQNDVEHERIVRIVDFIMILRELNFTTVMLENAIKGTYAKNILDELDLPSDSDTEIAFTNKQIGIKIISENILKQLILNSGLKSDEEYNHAVTKLVKQTIKTFESVNAVFGPIYSKEVLQMISDQLLEQQRAISLQPSLPTSEELSELLLNFKKKFLPQYNALDFDATTEELFQLAQEFQAQLNYLNQATENYVKALFEKQDFTELEVFCLELDGFTSSLTGKGLNLTRLKDIYNDIKREISYRTSQNTSLDIDKIIANIEEEERTIRAVLDHLENDSSATISPEKTPGALLSKLYSLIPKLAKHSKSFKANTPTGDKIIKTRASISEYIEAYKERQLSTPSSKKSSSKRTPKKEDIIDTSEPALEKSLLKPIARNLEDKFNIATAEALLNEIEFFEINMEVPTNEDLKIFNTDLVTIVTGKFKSVHQQLSQFGDNIKKEQQRVEEQQTNQPGSKIATHVAILTECEKQLKIKQENLQKLSAELNKNKLISSIEKRAYLVQAIAKLTSDAGVYESIAADSADPQHLQQTAEKLLNEIIAQKAQLEDERHEYFTFEKEQLTTLELAIYNIIQLLENARQQAEFIPLPEDNLMGDIDQAIEAAQQDTLQPLDYPNDKLPQADISSIVAYHTQNSFNVISGTLHTIAAVLKKLPGELLEFSYSTEIQILIEHQERLCKLRADIEIIGNSIVKRNDFIKSNLTLKEIAAKHEDIINAAKNSRNTINELASSQDRIELLTKQNSILEGALTTITEAIAESTALENSTKEHLVSLQEKPSAAINVEIARLQEVLKQTTACRKQFHTQFEELQNFFIAYDTQLIAIDDHIAKLKEEINTHQSSTLQAIDNISLKIKAEEKLEEDTPIFKDERDQYEEQKEALKLKRDNLRKTLAKLPMTPKDSEPTNSIRRYLDFYANQPHPVFAQMTKRPAPVVVSELETGAERLHVSYTGTQFSEKQNDLNASLSKNPNENDADYETRAIETAFAIISQAYALGWNSIAISGTSLMANAAYCYAQKLGMKISLVKPEQITPQPAKRIAELLSHAVFKDTDLLQTAHKKARAETAAEQDLAGIDSDAGKTNTDDLNAKTDNNNSPEKDSNPGLKLTP